MIHGKNLTLSLNGTPIAASRECDIDMKQDYITCCNPTNGRTTKKIPTRYDWTIGAGGLIASADYADSLMSLLVTGTVLTARFYDPSLGINRQGYAIVESLSMQGSLGSILTYSIKLQGSGPLESLGVPLTFSPFQDGDDIHFVYDSHTDVLSFAGGDLTEYAQFNCPDNSILNIKQTGTLSVLMTGGLDSYSVKFHERDASIFNTSARLYAGTSNTLLTLPAGRYTLFCNEDEEPTAMLIARS